MSDIRKCVCCHRDLDTPRRDFLSDVAGRKWCFLCVEFALSLVDPDVAWARVAPGPKLEGARDE